MEKEFLDHLKKSNGIIPLICHRYLPEGQHEDLEQDILITAWEAFPSFRGDSKFTTWFYALARNTTTVFLRKKLKYETTEILVSPKTLEGMRVGSSERNKKQEELLHDINTIITSLEPQDQLLIQLYRNQIGYKEIARITKLSEGSLRVRIHRLKQQLRSAIILVQNQKI